MISDLNTDNKSYTFIESTESEADFFFHIEFKKKNHNLIQHLEETINLYTDIVSHINDNCVYNYNTVDLMNLYEKMSNETKENLDILKNIQKINDEEIYENCEHDFITDIVEINDEKIKTVCYCTICEFTKEPN